VAEIKSALEIALEKADRIGRATPQEMAETQMREEARYLAGDFMREKVDLTEALQKISAESRPIMVAAVKEVLLRNINLPREGIVDESNQRAQAGMLQVARDKKTMQRLLQELAQVFASYAQVRNNARQQLKANMGAQMGGARRAMEAQMQRKLDLEIENMPQFLEEWRKFEAQLLKQFEPLVEKHKAQMATL
jgi:hypothetical protein